MDQATIANDAEYLAPSLEVFDHSEDPWHAAA
jgi:hypothetical protein